MAFLGEVCTADGVGVMFDCCESPWVCICGVCTGAGVCCATSVVAEEGLSGAPPELRFGGRPRFLG